MGLLCDYICFSYLRTFAARKIIFAAVFYICMCACTLYIWETPKTLLFDVCSRFRVLSVCYTNFRFWYVCSRLFLFPFSLAFCFTKIVRETLCKFLYVYASLKCIFMQYIMINRKLFWEFRAFSVPLQKRSIFLLFVFSLFLLFWINYRKRKQKRKSRIFAVFARKRPFLSQIMY